MAIAGYHGILRGARAEVPLNAIVAIGALIKGPIAAVTIFFTESGLIGFGLVHAAATLFECFALRRLTCSKMRPISAHDSGDPAPNVREFVVGALKLGSVTVAGVIAANANKFVAGKLFSATTLAHYLIGAQGAAVIFVVTGPVFYFFLPKLSHLAGNQGPQASVGTVSACRPHLSCSCSAFGWCDSMVGRAVAIVMDAFSGGCIWSQCRSSDSGCGCVF